MVGRPVSNPYEYNFTEPVVSHRANRDRHARSKSSIPWQLWVVIVLFAVEGVGNLLAIPAMPIAALWLATKLLFITGLIRRWRIVFVLFLAVAALHVFAFANAAPFVAFLNLLMLILVASQLRRFFPADAPSQYNKQPIET